MFVSNVWGDISLQYTRSFSHNLVRIPWVVTWLRRPEQIISLPKQTNVTTQLATSASASNNAGWQEALLKTNVQFVVNVAHGFLPQARKG